MTRGTHTTLLSPDILIPNCLLKKKTRGFGEEIRMFASCSSWSWQVGQLQPLGMSHWLGGPGDYLRGQQQKG